MPALTAAVTEAGDGPRHLADDATVLRLDRYGPRPAGRAASAGADT